MHGVLIKVSIADRDAAEKGLHEVVVPRASSAPGFVSGTWLYLGGAGASIIVFDSEANARAFAEAFQGPGDAPVTLESVDVGEVVARA